MSTADFCSCANLKCQLHPTNHDDGCTPCIKKNLETREIPNCFFNLLKNAEHRKGDSFKEFAKFVMANQVKLELII